jgi:orotidine-5'-phosphate decarboxylase
MLGFGDRLTAAVKRVGNSACIGLDPHPTLLPAPFQGRVSPRDRAQAARAFSLGVLEVCRGRVAAVKPQVAFFEALGSSGVAALEEVVATAKAMGLVVILDAKRGDIGSTAEAYAAATLDDDGPLGADAVTVSPYLGPESLAPFLQRCDSQGKGLFVLLRTSNPGSEGWQRPVAPSVAAWIESANGSRQGSSGFGPLGVVVGATLAAEAARWRNACPQAWFLAPGVGAQGASSDDLAGQRRSDGLGSLGVSARGVLFPPSGIDGEDWNDAVRARVELFVRSMAWRPPTAG